MPPVVRTTLLALLILLPASLNAQPFILPSPNRAIYDPEGVTKYFAPTPGRDWRSGTFGCVRSEGWQMHEGIDILPLNRDKKGEPTDDVWAAADGTVAYINRKVALSNYGNYIILKHNIEGLEVYTLYAHLASVRSDLKIGQPVKSREVIGLMGRTANTRQAITKDRAHLHFEINFMVNDRFSEWHKSYLPGQRNDHGDWNGQNLIGVDPLEVLREQHKDGSRYSFLNYIRNQRELCRIVVRDNKFPWLARYIRLVRRNPLAEKSGIAGYEIALNYNGLPFQLIPRSAMEIPGKARIQLLSVNAEEQAKHPCRRLVSKKGNQWELTATGQKLIDLLVY
ncbi:MAG TPA: M23 family metallopeptidase [Verrucomicrobiae bacterium]